MEKITPFGQELIFATSDKASSKRLTLLLKNNKVRKIATRVYTTNMDDDAHTRIHDILLWFQSLKDINRKSVLHICDIVRQGLPIFQMNVHELKRAKLTVVRLYIN